MENLKHSISNNKQMFYGFRKAFLQNPDVSLEARFTLVVLMTYKGKNKYCWPSEGKLAKKLGRDSDSVRKYLKELEAKGYLIRKSRGIGRSLLFAPSYLKISAGITNNNKNLSKPTEKTAHQPTEVFQDRSIVSENKDSGFLTGKDLFNQKRKELGL